MAKDTILITFALGRNTGKFLASETSGSKAMADAIAAMSVEFARQNTKIDVPGLTKRVKQTVETAYTEAVRYAANRMIGRQSTRAWGLTVEPIEMTIGGLFAAEWFPLSGRQIKKQQAGNPGQKLGKFYQDTGALKSELLAMARQMVRKTGVVKVQVKDHTREEWRKPLQATKVVPVADLKLVVLPNVYPSQLPGIRSNEVYAFDPSMKFERSLGLSDSAITKLRGPQIPGRGNLYHRPLLQPAFTYWTLYRIPTVIQEALNRSIVDLRRSTGSGVADYSGGR